MADWLRVEGKPADEVSLEELRRALADGDLFTVIGYMSRRLGRDFCAEHLRDAYPGVPELPPLYQALARLPFRGVVSTGYDTVLGRPFGIDEDDGPPVFTHVDGARSAPTRQLLPRRARRALPPHHADPVAQRAAPGRRRSDYAAFCRELFGRYSMVFVGYAPEDPDFVALVERHFGGAPRALLPHVMLADGISPLVSKELKAAHGVVVVPVGAICPPSSPPWPTTSPAPSRQPPRSDDLQGWLSILQTDATDGGAWEALACSRPPSASVTTTRPWSSSCWAASTTSVGRPIGAAP